LTKGRIARRVVIEDWAQTSQPSNGISIG